MTAGIGSNDTLFSVRSSPWHGLGAVLDKHPKGIDEAITAAGLDWEVIQIEPTFRFEGKLKKAKEYRVNVRGDTGDPLGVVTKRYKPVQNQAAFGFLASIFGSEMHFETAGSLMGGRRVWVMMKLPEYIDVGGDPIGQYAFIANSHDGKSSVVTAMTPVRIVCQNTLNMALNRAKGIDVKRTYTLRHIGDMDKKIIEARNVLQVTIDYYKAMKQVGDGLAQAKCSEPKVMAYLKSLLPIDDSMREKKTENREEHRQIILSLFRGEGRDGDTSGNSPGSYWALYNSAIEFLDWRRGEYKEGGRFQRSLYDPDALKAKAWDLILDSSGLRIGSKNKSVAKI